MAGNGTGPGWWAVVASGRPEVGADGYVRHPCGRCGARPANDICWWCGWWLCRDCWGEVGHCGHVGADQVPEERRRALYLRRCAEAGRAASPL